MLLHATAGSTSYRPHTNTALQEARSVHYTHKRCSTHRHAVTHAAAAAAAAEQAEEQEAPPAGAGDFEHRPNLGFFGPVILYWDYVNWLWRVTSKYCLDHKTGGPGMAERVKGAVAALEALDRDAGEPLRTSDLKDDFEATLTAARRLRDKATAASAAAQQVQRAEAGSSSSSSTRGNALKDAFPTAASTTVTGTENGGAVLVAAPQPQQQQRPKPTGKISNVMQRIHTGFTMGGLATFWIFMGNSGFAVGFFLQSILAQLEYYRMAMQKGHLPARRMSLVATTVLFSFACWLPAYHNYAMANAGVAIMLYFLLIRKTPGTISDISTTFMGIFYSAYLPSFWVRLRCIGTVLPVQVNLVQKLAPVWPVWAPKLLPPPDLWTMGALVTWWTYVSIIAADVGAYFVGKQFGKTKLATISKSAGYASPNKTIEVRTRICVYTYCVCILKCVTSTLL
jgi:CDP-diglyceride synthetase